MMRALLILLFVMTVAETRSSAVTVEQIVALSQSGVSDAVLLALIERDHPEFPIALAPEQLATLRQAGVSEAVVIAMLKSPRSAPQVPERPIEMRRPVGPDVVIVGHAPDVPNGSVEKSTVVFLMPTPMGSPFVAGGGISLTDTVRGCAPIALINAPPVVAPPSVGRFTGDSIGRFVSSDLVPAAGADGSLSLANSCHASAPRPRMRRAR